MQLVLFGLVMLAAAGFMLRETPLSGGASVTAPSSHEHGRAWIVSEGLTVGVLTGLVGVGGGFLVVPALVLLGKLPMKEAIGTSLLVIALKSFAGFAGYLGQVEIRWTFMTAFTALAVAGILAGTHLIRYVSPSALKRAFALLLLVVGGFILYQNRAVILLASSAMP